jgi:pimeloyl-ACP methyl ester carboxylesterase
MALPPIAHRFADIDGLRVFYREAGPPAMTPLLLLHGFPSGSHQFRRLFDALGTQFHVIAPDYPGFGYSDAPTSATQGGSFVYTFDRLSHIIERFCAHLELSRFVLFAFDFGGPIGFRVACRHPEWIAGLVVQNANAYEEGLSAVARDYVALRRDGATTSVTLGTLMTLDATRAQYLEGAGNPDTIAPDGWTLDQHFLDLPGRQQIQVDLALDYHTNVTLYPRWQAWLRQHQPPLLILWGRHDPFFLEEGAHAYLRDVPSGELHMFDTGHFALEEYAPEMAPLIAAFLVRIVSDAGR